MSRKRLIWQEMSDLALRLGQQRDVGAADVSELTQMLGKLGKVQFKANTLFEAQLEQQREALGSLRAALARQDEIISSLEKTHERDVETARYRLLLAVLPIADGLESAMNDGRQRLRALPPDSEAHPVLLSWLDGIAVIHRHILDVLSRNGVEPMQSVGGMFDPKRHVATGVDTSNMVPSGIVTAEELRGYLVGDEVLRYAEVVVSRPAPVIVEQKQAEPNG
jgi:molecular chaperone GrpE